MPISGAGARSGAWVRLSSAVLAGGDDCGAGNAATSWSAALLIDDVDCDAGFTCVSRSVVVAVLTGGGCGAGGARLSRSVEPSIAGTGVPTAAGAEIGAFDAPGPSHAHMAAAQMPTVATKVAATAAFRRLMLRSCILLPRSSRESFDALTSPASPRPGRGRGCARTFSLPCQGCRHGRRHRCSSSIRAPRPRRDRG